MELTREEMLCARIDMLSARVEELEVENLHYLELLNKAEKDIDAINTQLTQALEDTELDK